MIYRERWRFNLDRDKSDKSVWNSVISTVAIPMIYIVAYIHFLWIFLKNMFKNMKQCKFNGHHSHCHHRICNGAIQMTSQQSSTFDDIWHKILLVIGTYWSSSMSTIFCYEFTDRQRSQCWYSRWDPEFCLIFQIYKNYQRDFGCMLRRKPGQTLFEHQSAPMSINWHKSAPRQHQSASISMNQHKHQSTSASIGINKQQYTPISTNQH